MCFTKQNVEDVSGYAKAGNAFQQFKNPVITLNLRNLRANVKHQQ